MPGRPRTVAESAGIERSWLRATRPIPDHRQAIADVTAWWGREVAPDEVGLVPFDLPTVANRLPTIDLPARPSVPRHVGDVGSHPWCRRVFSKICGSSGRCSGLGMLWLPGWPGGTALRDDGQIIELSRGLFQLADQALEYVDFVAVCGRVPEGMSCLDSALAYWDLTDEIPRKVHVAVPTGASADDRLPTDAGPRVGGGHLRAGATGGRRPGRGPVLDLRPRAHGRGRVPPAAPAGEDLAHAGLRRYRQSRPQLARFAAVGSRFERFAPLGGSADAARLLLHQKVDSTYRRVANYGVPMLEAAVAAVGWALNGSTR